MQNRFVTLKGISSSDNYWKPTRVHTVSYGFPSTFTDFFFVTVPGTYSGDRKTPNPNEFSRSRTSYYSGVTTRENSNEYNVDTGPIPNTIAGQGIGFSSNTYNEALGKFNERLRGEVDLAVDLAEGGQTVHMIRSMNKIVNYVHSFNPRKLANYWAAFRKEISVRHVKSGSYRFTNDVKSVARSVGGRWLEFQYGWRPLAQDIYGSVIELGSSLPPLLRIEGRAKQHYSSSVVIPWFVDSLCKDSLTTDNSYRALIRARYRFPAEATQLLGKFTSLNPVNILWELTPYSFVVDWFLDVGGYLRNLESALLYNSAFIDGFVTEGYRTSSNSIVNGAYSASGSTYTKHYTGWTVNTAKRRTVLSFHPSPRLPRFKADLGSGRLLNAAALLSQFLR